MNAAQKIAQARKAQPIPELKRKADKATCKGTWTQEDFDLADAEAKKMADALAEQKPVKD